MKNPVKKIVAVHDLSGYGRCSFSVIMPTLSALGHQVCAIPTATLSTHTGGYENFVFRDLTSDIEPMWKHWQDEGFEFDAFYSGFLGSEEQIEIVERIISTLSPEVPVFVDPVMGDDGALYSTYTEEMKDGMKRLVKKATLITPNITEACFLIDEPVKEQFTKEEIENIIFRLKQLTPADVVITGIELENKTGIACLEKNEVKFYLHEKLDVSYPGTGDIFASTLIGKLLNSYSLFDASRFACDFVYELCEYSRHFDYPKREGVLLEAKLFHLFEKR